MSPTSSLAQSKEVYFCFILFTLLISCHVPDDDSFSEGSEQVNEGDRYYAIGDSLYYQQDWSEAIKWYAKASDHYFAVGDSLNFSITNNDIGLCKKKQGLYQEALLFYHKALEVDKARNDSGRVASLFRNIGNVNRNQGRYFDALSHYLASLQWKSSAKASGRTFIAIGNIYLEIGQVDKSLEYFEKALDFVYQMDSSNLATLENNIGNAYLEKKAFHQALKHYRHSLVLGSDPILKAYSLGNLGISLLKTGDLDSSEYYLHKSLAIKENAGLQKDMAYTYNVLGDLYLQKGILEQATYFIKKAEEYSKKEENHTITVENLRLKSELLHRLDVDKEAYKLFKVWAEARDSLFNTQKLRILNLQRDYDVSEKESQRLIAEQKIDMQRLVSASRLRIIYVSLTISGLLMIFLLIFFFQRKKIGRLNYALELKSRDMFHRKQNDYHRILDMIEPARFPAADIIRNMLYASSSIDETLYTDLQSSTNLKTYLGALIEDIKETYQSREIKIHTSFSEVFMDPENANRIGFVLSELITNTVKHSFFSYGETIKITIDQNDKKLVCQYRDNGQPFQDKPSTDKGGMGLGLINDFLRSMKSQISRECKDGWNTATFVIVL